jgi:hypothetical protein
MQKVWGQGLRDDDKRFEPAERLQSSDCYRGAAMESVQAFYHSEEGSRLDTQSYRVFTMPNLETGARSLLIMDTRRISQVVSEHQRKQSTQGRRNLK